jgi:hypothetical protein
MKASELTTFSFHFPLLVVVDLIKQVTLWWGLAFEGVEDWQSQYLGHGIENIKN